MYFSQGRADASFLNRLVYLTSLILLIGILHNKVVSASPIHARDDGDDGIEPDDPNSDVDDPPDILSPFSPTAEYPDLDTCRSKVSVATDKSVFYSQVGKHEEKPQDFANTIGGVLLREAYPTGFTDKSSSFTGSYKKFLDRASQAFAEKTAGTTHVLLPTDGTDISKKVWTKTEKPALIASGGVCNRIVKVDPNDFSKQCVLWDRGGASDPNLPNCDQENGPVPDKSTTSAPPNQTYTPGWCGLHVTQYQKNEADSNPTGNYKLDVHIFDAAQREIGSVAKADAPSGQGVNVDSALPLVLVVTAQNVDNDAVLFAYGAQSWGSNDQPHQCNFGAYDSGKREGDCGFTC